MNLTAHYGAGVSPLAELSGGWETVIYAFRTADGRERVLRQYQGPEALTRSEIEFTTMQRLHQMGYPVPLVEVRETDPPYITMERINGGTLDRVDGDFFRLLVDLHRLDAEPFNWMGVTPESWLPTIIGAFKAGLGDLEAMFGPVADWLMANRPTVARLSLLHGDFHPYNVLVDGDGATYVIDWTASSVGDYRYDVAWTRLLTGADVSIYEAVGGDPLGDLTYFDVICYTRRLWDFAGGVTGGIESRGMRPEALAMMRERLGWYRGLYDRLRQHTGLGLAELGALLDQFAGG